MKEMKKMQLYNGETVIEGDRVQFTNSKGKVFSDKIRKDPITNRLYFWNYHIKLTNYPNLKKEI